MIISLDTQKLSSIFADSSASLVYLRGVSTDSFHFNKPPSSSSAKNLSPNPKVSTPHQEFIRMKEGLIPTYENWMNKVEKDMCSSTSVNASQAQIKQTISSLSSEIHDMVEKYCMEGYHISGLLTDLLWKHILLVLDPIFLSLRNENQIKETENENKM